MNCLELENQVPDFLAGSLAPSITAKVQAHLLECSTCRNELQDLSELWANLGVMPVARPSAALRTEFYARLESAKIAEATVPPISKQWLNQTGRNILLQVAAGFLLVTGGWLAGRAIGGESLPSHADARFTRTEPIPRQQVDWALLAKPNVSKRMLGVALISRLPSRDPSLAKALLELLKHDPSVQVRLAAVDALYPYSDIPWIRKELETALFGQQSPLTQLALVDLMKDLRDESTFNTLSALVQDQAVSPEVRERALMALSIDPCNLFPSGEYSYYPSRQMKTTRAVSGSHRKAPIEVENRGSGDELPGRGSARESSPPEKVPWYVVYFSKRRI